LRLPACQVSSVAFGGPDLADLYVTTAAEPWPSRLAPAGFDPAAPGLGGPLYRVRLDVPGRLEHRAGFAWPEAPTAEHPADPRRLP
jgi:D-xylonolactonase